MLHQKGTSMLGSVLQFKRRPEPIDAEETVRRVGEMFQRRQRAKEVLPRLLSAAIAAGLADLALRAMSAWGDGSLQPEEVLDLVETEAALEGVRCLLP